MLDCPEICSARSAIAKISSNLKVEGLPYKLDRHAKNPSARIETFFVNRHYPSTPNPPNANENETFSVNRHCSPRPDRHANSV